MLSEIYNYLSTPCKKKYRKLGYLSESIAIDARRKRVKSSWDEHLKQTKATILSATENICQHRHGVILGSGSMFDIPIEELARMFEKITLVDVIHTKPSRSIIKKFNNIELLECDVSGVADSLNHGSIKKQLPSPHLDCSWFQSDTDLVISANLLSQLPAVPKNYIKTRSNLDEDHINNWCKKIVEAHLEMLSSLYCAVCLITDNRRTFFDNDGTEDSNESALYDVALPKPKRSWTWDIAPKGEEAYGSISNTVWAYPEWK